RRQHAVSDAGGVRAMSFARWVAVIVIAVGVIAPGRAEAAFPGPNGKIVFSRANDLYTVNADGSGLTDLTNTDSSVRESAPAWSADGTKFAFRSSGRLSGSDTYSYVMSSDGSNVPRITSRFVCDGRP